MIQIIAVLCSLADGRCIEMPMADSDHDPAVTMSGCGIGLPSLVDRLTNEGLLLKYRLAGWKCQFGRRERI